MFRSVVPGDSDAVTSLAVSAALFAPEDSGVVRSMMEGYFATGRSEGHVCLLDDDAGEPRAVAYYEPAPVTDRTWFLTMLAVRPDQQGQGRGAGLLAHLEDLLRDRGQRLLLIQTSSTEPYAHARGFYAACGYDQEARVRDYYEPGDDMIVFRKALGPTDE